nr:MAG: wsv526-like protein [Hemigrapsus takanoi nimavirus]
MDIENDAHICVYEHDLLGYIQYLYNVEEEEMEVDEEKENEEEDEPPPSSSSSSSSSDIVIDPDALNVNDTVNLKAVVDVEGGIKIPPYSSVDVCMGRVKVVKGQEYDGSVCKLMRFPELVSAKNGLVLTQELLEKEEYETENLSITVFNVTNKDLIVQDGDVLVKVVVAEASVVF